MAAACPTDGTVARTAGFTPYSAGEENEVQVPSGSDGDHSADFDPQGGTARPGGRAEGGVEPQQGDSATPAKADPADVKARREMRAAGFGDDKGGDIS